MKKGNLMLIGKQILKIPLLCVKHYFLVTWWLFRVYIWVLYYWCIARWLFGLSLYFPKYYDIWYKKKPKYQSTSSGGSIYESSVYTSNVEKKQSITPQKNDTPKKDEPIIPPIQDNSIVACSEIKKIKTMATFKITQTTTVAELKSQFSQEIGGVLRIYDGRSEASESATLVSLGATPKEWECRTSRTVGSFEKAFQAEFNLKVKVYTVDNWVKVLDDITLETASKLPNGMTKAKMEEYVSNYSKSGKTAVPQ